MQSAAPASTRSPLLSLWHLRGLKLRDLLKPGWHLVGEKVFGQFRVSSDFAESFGDGERNFAAGMVLFKFPLALPDEALFVNPQTLCAAILE